MSTRNIRQALADLSRIKGMTQVQAYEELEAIEMAATERVELAEAIAEGDKDALERLAQMACDERNAHIEKVKP